MLARHKNTLPRPLKKDAGKYRGLTIVEMLVTMGICVLLALLLVPVVFRSRERARQVVCKGNLNNLGQTYTVCLMENHNYLPAVYYSIEETDEMSLITLRSANEDVPDVLFENNHRDGLVCPSDDRPAEVLARATNGMALPLGASYAYNISLPINFRVATRVPYPMNTVTFYDGDPTSVIGEWELRTGWAEPTISKRHIGAANYLFLDGHVETTENFPEIGFDGGVSSPALGGQSAGLGNDSPWAGSTFTDDDSDDETAPPEEDDSPNSLSGSININPANGTNFEFTLELPDGFEITRDDLHADDPISHGNGFNANYLEYAGPAALVMVKPKGNANQNGLLLNGEPYRLYNKNRYTITSTSMTVHLYNDKRNKKGKAMGHWWIDIAADDAEIEIME